MLVGAFAKLRPICRQNLVQHRLLGLPAWTTPVRLRGMRRGAGWSSHGQRRGKDCAERFSPEPVMSLRAVRWRPSALAGRHRHKSFDAYGQDLFDAKHARPP
jgi:hypothetical protein